MDSVSEIRTQLNSLSSIKNLASARHKAGYDDKRRMNEFVILKGRFWLDTCGNFSKIVEIAGDTSKLTDVMTREEAYAALGKDGSITSTTAWLPQEHQRCPVCQHEWTVEDCHDYERTDFGGYHANCLYLKNASENFADFQSAFRLAGFEYALFAEIENEYGGRPDRYRHYYTPWYNVTTPVGVIKIGWRKRVINIDWSATGKDLAIFFHREDVTKWDHGIHAWGYSKAVEYLRELRDLLSCTPEGLARSRKYAEEAAAARKKTQ